LDLPAEKKDDEKGYLLSIPATLRRLGAELRFIIDGDAVSQASADPALVKALLQARRWWRLWLASDGKSLKEIARDERVNDRYLSQLMPLAFLAPDITQMILDGRQPADLTAERLIKHTKLPVDWSEQRRLLIARPIRRKAHRSPRKSHRENGQ